MRPPILVMAVLGLAAIGTATAYQAAARQHEYATLLARGDAALRDDQTFEAIEAYSGALALRPDSMLACLRRGQTYQRRGGRADLEAAARDFRAAAALDPAATRPLEALGDVLCELQRYDGAADAYEKCLRLDDRSARAAYHLGLARYRQHDLDRALAAVREALRLDDRIAGAHYLLGMCLRERRRPGDALREFERAVAIEPAMIPAREELADLYGALNRRAEELEQLQLVAGLDRNHATRQVAVAMAHARAGQWDVAVVALRSALERNPGNADVYRALGQVWLDRPREDRAYVTRAREALEHIGGSQAASSATLLLYARALLEDDDADAAERVLQQAVARFPIEPQALLLYATVAEKQNHLDTARAALVQYGALAPAGDADSAARAAHIADLSERIRTAAPRGRR